MGVALVLLVHVHLGLALELLHPLPRQAGGLAQILLLLRAPLPWPGVGVVAGRR